MFSPPGGKLQKFIIAKGVNVVLVVLHPYLRLRRPVVCRGSVSGMVTQNAQTCQLGLAWMCDAIEERSTQ